MSTISKVAMVGNYMPRRCGIATFTTDISEALAEKFPDAEVLALPVNDIEEGYDYPPRVRFELVEQEIASYRRAADFLNIQDVDVACIQHEYGIYGGAEGSHLLRMMERLRMPVVSTLHTILEEPTPNQHEVLKKICEYSDRIITMAERGRGYLQDIYGVPPEKIDFVHHGIPDFPFADPNFHKDRFGVEGKIVLLTFGLLAPNKGIEYVIQALPRIIARHPEVVYIVQGATHPQLLRHQGEAYRLRLQRLVAELGLQEHVIFHNRFVEIEELKQFISAADVYICPYLNERQMVSGTLAYTTGAGKPVISTPLWYAEELLADGRGIIVPAKDSDAIAGKVNWLLENEIERHAMRKRAYMLGREMIWPVVAENYMACFEQAIADRAMKPRPVGLWQTAQSGVQELPPMKLQHLKRMTDYTGLIQHANYTVPDYNHGYCLDDNARALILCGMLERRGERLAAEALDLSAIYLGYINYASEPETRHFRNFMGYSRQWLEEAGSEDSHGRALWALGATVGRTRVPGYMRLATQLFEQALPQAAGFTSLRASAFALLGIQEFLRRFYGHTAAQDLRLELAERLLRAYAATASDDWRWFEDKVTYSNARIPHALMLAGQWLERGEMVEAALDSLQWLADIQRRDGGHFVPIGCHGFYVRGEEPARFDQQPIEACAMVAAALQAYRLTRDHKWLREANRAFNWFLGQNDLGTPVFDPSTGGCYDGLEPDGLNQNQGAESTLAFLLSLAEMQTVEHVVAEVDETEGVGAASSAKA